MAFITENNGSELTYLPCADKLAFDTLAKAQATATTVKWQRGTKLKTYKCRHCQLWHLSSN